MPWPHKISLIKTLLCVQVHMPVGDSLTAAVLNALAARAFAAFCQLSTWTQHFHSHCLDSSAMPSATQPSGHHASLQRCTERLREAVARTSQLFLLCKTPVWVLRVV
jgi:hypothetical protein